MGNNNFVETKIVKINEDAKDLSLCAVNEFYFALVKNFFTVSIYDLTNKFKKIMKKDCKSFIKYLEFHPKYKDIFITALLEKEIKIWKIMQDKPLCIFKGHNDNIRFSKFNPKYPELVASTALDNTVKIWNIHSILINKNILLNNCIISMKWSISGNLLGFKEESNNLIIYKREDLEWIKKFFFEVPVFIRFEILNDNSIFLIDKEFIEERDFNNNITKKIELNDSFPNYCLNYNEIYFFNSKKISILNLKNIKDYNIFDIEYKFEGCLNEQKFIRKITYEDKTIFEFIVINKEIEKIYFFEIDIEKKNNSIINYFNKEKFKDNNIIEIKIKEKNEMKEIIEENEFIEKIIPIIFDNKAKLHYSHNINENLCKTPKYFENDFIKTELNNLSNLFMRKKEVEKELENMKISKNNPILQYQNYLLLLIKDNTNIKLLRKYLKFLQGNDKKLNSLKIETFNDEINHYQCLFKKNGPFLKSINIFKEKSEFQQFCEILKSIKECKDFFLLKNNYIKQIDSLTYFNQPIKYKVNELFYYRNKAVLIISFKNLGKDKFMVRKKIVSYILENKILQDKTIINDPDKISFLIIIILYSTIQNYKFYLNMLTSNKNENNDKIKAEIKKFKDKEFICVNNIKYLGDYNENELYNYDYLMKNPPIGIDKNKIKLFINKILKSKVFKEILETLYEDPNFISIDELIDYFDNNIKFIPFKSNTLSALTDKFTNMTYIFSMDKNVENLNNYQNKLISSILKTAIIIVIIFHEIGHKIYALYFYSKNNNISLLSPRKNENLDGESGQYIEILLFGRIINTINVPEAQYIINEMNYNKSLNDFTIGFNELKAQDLIGNNSIFCEFDSIKNYFNFEKERESLQNIIIKAKEGYKDIENCFIKINNKNDIMGMTRNCDEE